MFAEFRRMVDEVNRFNEEVSDDLNEWFEEVHIDFMIARGLADMMAWLRDAKGENAAAMRAHCKQAHRRTLMDLRRLAQRAYMLWGVNISLPKGLKDEE